LSARSVSVHGEPILGSLHNSKEKGAHLLSKQSSPHSCSEKKLEEKGKEVGGKEKEPSLRQNSSGKKEESKKEKGGVTSAWVGRKGQRRFSELLQGFL